jgi:protease I
MYGRLKGRRIALLAADGFEKVELTVPLRAMQLAGAKVDVISLRHGRIRGVNLHEPAGRIHVDKTIDEARTEDYDGLFIPGGLINPDLLRQSSDARYFVRKFMESGKPVATLCHGPWMLASAELARGRTMTSWPGIRDDLVHAGAVWVDQPTVRDGNLLTSRGPQDLREFVPTLVDFYATGGERPAQIVNALTEPQAERPPAMMVKALRWMPRPSFRTVFAMLAVALGIPSMRRALLGGRVQRRVMGRRLERRLLGGPVERRLFGSPLERRLFGGPVRRRVAAAMR